MKSGVACKQDFLTLKSKARAIKKIKVNDVFGNGIDSICIRTFTERERGVIADKIFKSNKSGVFTVDQERPWIIAYGVCDETGNRIFGDDDVDSIRDMDSGLIAAIYNEIESFGKVSFVREAERIEDTAKN